MSRRVYLHIGAPKTGTTYLQDRLTLNAGTLRSHDVHLPTSSPLVSPGALPLPRGPRRPRPGLGRTDRARGRRLGHHGQAGAAPRRHRADQPRDLRAGPARADPAGAPRPARQRGARRLLRARPRPPAARGLAGEHQAGPQVGLPALPEPRRAGLDVVLPRLRPAAGAREVERGRPARSGCTSSPSRSRAALQADRDLLWRRMCEAFGIDPDVGSAGQPPREPVPRRRRDRGHPPAQPPDGPGGPPGGALRRADPGDAGPGEPRQPGQHPGPAAPAPLRLGRGAGPGLDRLAGRQRCPGGRRRRRPAPAASGARRGLASTPAGSPTSSSSTRPSTRWRR